MASEGKKSKSKSPSPTKQTKKSKPDKSTDEEGPSRSKSKSKTKDKKDSGQKKPSDDLQHWYFQCPSKDLRNEIVARVYMNAINHSKTDKQRKDLHKNKETLAVVTNHAQYMQTKGKDVFVNTKESN